MLWDARRRAKNKGLPCTITEADTAVPEVCPVLGLTFTPGVGKNCDTSVSLDRLIPSLGYVPGNVAVISWRANRLKGDATAEELRKIADWMDRHSAGH